MLKDEIKYKDFLVGEHTIKIPIPLRQSDIFFLKQTKDNQYWDRDKFIAENDYRKIWFDFIPNYTRMDQASTNYDSDGILVSLNPEDSQYVDRIYQQETWRRLNGIHFMNNGEVTWITGDHYFFLMYARIQRHDGKGNFADYREFQRDYLYLIHHCNTSRFNGQPNILGLFLTKAKKTGITNIHWSGYYLNKATLYKNRNLGYMNIDLNQAAKTFNDYFMYSYNGLISPLRADYRSRSLNDGNIVFAKSYTSSKKVKYNTDEDDLNTSVTCVPTKNKAFDVAVMSDITFDEPTKYKENFGEIWRTNKEAVKIQSKINGRAWLFNYTPEDNGESFRAARKIFFESELKTITGNSEGQTISGLICHHIPAYESWEGAFDKFGKCDKQKAMMEIQRERDKVSGDANALAAITRQYANSKREAWGSGGVTSVFDPVRLGELDVDLEMLQRAEKTFEWGHYEWENPIWEVGRKDRRPKGVFGRVKWVPITEEQRYKGKEDKVRLYNTPLPQDVNQAILFGKDEYNNLLPPPIFLYCGGIDPADWKEAGSIEEGSMIAMDTMAVHNTARNTQSKKVVTKIQYAEYLGRPDNPQEWYEDIVKQIVYWGQLTIIEANNGVTATKLEEEGLGHYMLFKNSEGVICRYKANHKNLPVELGGKLKHIKNVKAGSVDIISDLILYIKSYLQRAVKEYGEIDYGALIRSERFIRQAKEFDPQDTKRFDLVMAKGYALMCHENYLALLNQYKEDTFKEDEVNAMINALDKWY